jgi:hypothetical protein
MSVVALIGRGPSRDAYWFGEGVGVMVVNRWREEFYGDGHHNVVTIPEHFNHGVEAGWVSVLCESIPLDRDAHGFPVMGHAAPRILRRLIITPSIDRIYLQGFDLSTPEYAKQLREFRRVAIGAMDLAWRVIVTTPGPLDKLFTCRAPDPEHLGVAR